MFEPAILAKYAEARETIATLEQRLAHAADGGDHRRELNHLRQENSDLRARVAKFEALADLALRERDSAQKRLANALEAVGRLRS